MENELQIIESCVLKASKLLEENDGNLHIETKSSARDLVTMYDKAIQSKLYELLSEAFPDAGFLGEEGLNKTENSNEIFIIDPIDGTTNFIKGMNHSAISVGLYRNGDIECGCIYNPFTDEMFTAAKGQGAYLNGVQIHVSDEEIGRSVGLYGTAPYNAELREKSFRLANEITKRVIDSRRMGAATLDMCYVACGRAELYVEYQLCPWDYAAGYIIAKEAGAIVTDVRGNQLPFLEKSSVAVGTPKTHPILMEMVEIVG